MVLRSPAEPLGPSTDGVIPGMACLNGDSAAPPGPDVGGSVQARPRISVRGHKRFGAPAGDRPFRFESRT
jgi:hypothetical protein